jgi:GH24 family phage-related lysozyme (muramidase)
VAGTLPSFKEKLEAALKAEGLIPMSTGVTRPFGPVQNYSELLTTTLDQVDAANAAVGSRLWDRYSTDVGDTYRDRRYELISGFENVRTRMYDDSGNPAIGLGFNMNRSNAKELWSQAIGNAVSFEDAKAGKATITPAQAKSLFDHDILYFEGVVDRASKGRKLTQNQRLALVSVAYTSPKRVMDNAELIRTGSDEQVMDFILHNSFNPDHPYKEGLKKRRYAEASLFGSLSEAKDYMPSWNAYNEAVEVDESTGEVSLRSRLVPGKDASHADGVDPEFAGRLTDLFNAAPDNIRDDLGIYSGYRSVEHQKKLWDAALEKYGSAAAARKWVAPPGRSNHNHGMAVDLSYKGASLARAPKEVVAWVHENAPKYGLAFPLANENWHIEPVEVRQGKKLVPRSRLAPIPDAAPQPMPREAGTRARALNAVNSLGLIDPSKEAPNPLVRSKSGKVKEAVSEIGLIDPSKIAPTPLSADQRVNARNRAWTGVPNWVAVQAPKPLPYMDGMRARANAAGLMFVQSGQAKRMAEVSDARYAATRTTSRTTTRIAQSSQSSQSGGSSGKSYSGLTDVGGGKFVDSEGGVYYSRHLS